MKNNICYLLVLILIALIATNAVISMAIDNGDSNQSIKLYNETVAKRPWFTHPCKKPQSRVYILSELLENTYKDPSNIVDKPIYIVFKLCDVHSGCCHSSTRTCVPDKSKIYYEKLQIDIYSVANYTTTKVWFKLEQHGECICEDIGLQQVQDKEKRLPKIIKI